MQNLRKKVIFVAVVATLGSHATFSAAEIDDFSESTAPSDLSAVSSPANNPFQKFGTFLKAVFSSENTAEGDNNSPSTEAVLSENDTLTIATISEEVLQEAVRSEFIVLADASAGTAVEITALDTGIPDDALSSVDNQEYYPVDEKVIGWSGEDWSGAYVGAFFGRAHGEERKLGASAFRPAYKSAGTVTEKTTEYKVGVLDTSAFTTAGCYDKTTGARLGNVSPCTGGNKVIDDGEKWPHSFEQTIEYFKWSIC